MESHSIMPIAASSGGVGCGGGSGSSGGGGSSSSNVLQRDFQNVSEPSGGKWSVAGSSWTLTAAV